MNQFSFLYILVLVIHYGGMKLAAHSEPKVWNVNKLSKVIFPFKCNIFIRVKSWLFTLRESWPNHADVWEGIHVFY